MAEVNPVFFGHPSTNWSLQGIKSITGTAERKEMPLQKFVMP
jgi:hypothetical protein